MKVTINKPEDSIDLSMVTEDMYFVGTEEGKADCILSREDYNKGNFFFLSLSNITNRNGYSESGGDNLNHKIVGWLKGFKNREVHAFRTYQEAFKFIADNL